jgi:hypothetical protein
VLGLSKEGLVPPAEEPSKSISKPSKPYLSIIAITEFTNFVLSEAFVT